jgi:hypothetical protein
MAIIQRNADHSAQWRLDLCPFIGAVADSQSSRSDKRDMRLHFRRGQLLDREDIFPGVNNSSYTHKKFSR